MVGVAIGNRIQESGPPWGITWPLSLPLPTKSFTPMESPPSLKTLITPLPDPSPISVPLLPQSCISKVPAPREICPFPGTAHTCLKPVGSTSHGPSFLRHLPAHSLLPQRYCPHTPPPPRRRINSWRPTGRCGDLRSWRSLSQVDELGQGGRLSQAPDGGEAHIPFCQP